MSEHRVSVLSASLSRYVDPARSRDPRVRAVVAQLSTLPIAPPPRAHFRAELRAQLVAVAPRLVSEGIAAETPMIDIVPRPTPVAQAAAPRHTDSRGLLAVLARIRIGRPLAVAASMVTAFALLLGGAVLMSRKALPGDALYGLKRASEQWELATAGSDSEKAQDYIDFATTRANEVKGLLERASTTASGAGAQAAGLVNSHTASLISSTLSSADSDVKSASQLLGTQAVRNESASPLSAMTKWAPTQLQRLRQIAAAMPAGALRTRTTSSANLVKLALHRATSLQGKVDCACMSGAVTDDLGPIPCTVCAPPNVVSPVKPGSRHAAKHHGSTPPANTHNIVPVVPHHSASVTPNNDPSTTTSTPAHTRSGIHLPTLPPLPTSGLPSLPVNVSSCGIGVDIGPLHLKLGECPPSPHAS